MVIDSTYILKLEPTVFVDGLDVGYEKRKESYGGVFMEDYMSKEKIKNNIEKKKQTC